MLYCFVLVTAAVCGVALSQTTTPSCDVCGGTWLTGDRITSTRNHTVPGPRDIAAGTSATVLCGGVVPGTLFVRYDNLTGGTTPSDVPCACTPTTADTSLDVFPSFCVGYLKLSALSYMLFDATSLVSDSAPVRVPHGGTVPRVAFQVLNGRRQPDASADATHLTVTASAPPGITLRNDVMRASGSVVSFEALQIVGCVADAFRLTFTASAAGTDVDGRTLVTGLVLVYPRPREVVRMCAGSVSTQISVTVGDGIIPAPCVEVLNSCGALDTTFDGNFAVVASVPAGFLDGTVMRPAVGGTAVFGDLTLRYAHPTSSVQIFVTVAGVEFAGSTVFGYAASCPVGAGGRSDCGAVSYDECVFVRNCCWDPVSSRCTVAATCSDVPPASQPSLVCNAINITTECPTMRTLGACSLTCGACAESCDVNNGTFFGAERAIPFPLTGWGPTALGVFGFRKGTGVVSVSRCFRVCRATGLCEGVTHDAVSGDCYLFRQGARIQQGHPSTWTSAAPAEHCPGTWTPTATADDVQTATMSRERLTGSMSRTRAAHYSLERKSKTYSISSDATLTPSPTETKSRTRVPTITKTRFAPGIVTVSAATLTFDIEAMRDPESEPRPQLVVQLRFDKYFITAACELFIRKTVQISGCVPFDAVISSIDPTMANDMVITMGATTSEDVSCPNGGSVTVYIPPECVVSGAAPRVFTPVSTRIIELSSDNVRRAQGVLLLIGALAAAASPLVALSGLAHAQTLQMLVEMNCVLPGIRIASRQSRWLLRPYDLQSISGPPNYLAGAYLHAGIVLVFTALHAAVFAMVKSDGVSWTTARANVYFPHVSIALTMALIPGLVGSAVRIVLDKTNSTGAMARAAILAFGISFTLIVLCAAVGVLIESVWIPGKYRTFFVSGQWKDGDLKRGWYCLLNEAGPGRKKAYPTALLLYVLIMAVITGMRPTVQSTCATQLGGVLTLQILFAALVMYLKPLRSKWLRYHTIVMIIFQLCFAAVMLFRARNIASEITIGAQGLNGLLAVCVITNILFVVVAFVVMGSERFGVASVAAPQVVVLEKPLLPLTHDLQVSTAADSWVILGTPGYTQQQGYQQQPQGYPYPLHTEMKQRPQGHVTVVEHDFGEL